MNRVKTNLLQRSGQAGFSLIGAVLMLVIGGILMTWIANRSMEQMRAAQGAVIGREMARLNNAVLDFSRRYHYQIKMAVADNRPLVLPEGSEIKFSNRVKGRNRKHLYILNNAIDESGKITDIDQMLKAVKMQGINTRPPLPDTLYRIRFEVGDASRPDGLCQKASLSACYIDSIVYIDKPITKTGSKPDYLRLNAAHREMGVGAGFSVETDSGKIRFSASDTLSNPAPLANPLGNDIAGILVIANTRSVEHLPYVRLDGKEPMQGNLVMGLNEITMATQPPSAGSAPDARIRYRNGQLLIGTSGGEMRITAPPTSDHRHVEINGGKLQANEIVAQEKMLSKRNIQFSENALAGGKCEGLGIAVDAEGNLMHCKLNDEQQRVWQIVKGTHATPSNYAIVDRSNYCSIAKCGFGDGTGITTGFILRDTSDRPPPPTTSYLSVYGDDWMCTGYTYRFQDKGDPPVRVTTFQDKSKFPSRWAATAQFTEPWRPGHLRRERNVIVSCRLKGPWLSQKN